MNAPNGDRYRRRLSDPASWPSNFPDYAVERTRCRVNELAWELAGHQVADEAAAFLRAQDERRARRDTAQAEGWQGGEPGE